MSPEQKILAETYAEGDVAHVTTEAEAAGYMDTLFLFLWRELAPDGDTDRAEYIRRLERAENDILTIRHALEIYDA